jgi:hypothetical protein
MRSWLFPLILALGLLSVADSAQAAGLYGPRSEYSPSVFSYGWRGLAVGGLAGLSLGYVIARDDGFESDDWKPVAYGLGIGALSGGVIGLALGFVDLEDDRPGMGNIALRDMLYGALFGLVVGGIVGGIAVISTEDAEHILFGAALGTMFGTLAGLVVGIIEGRRIVDSPQHRYPGRALGPSFAFTRTPRGELTPVIGVQGAF